MTECNHKRLADTKYQTFCLDCGARIDIKSILSESGWRDMGDMPPTDAPYYVAGKTGADPTWQVRRWHGEPPTWATHWHRDTLGLPVV